MVLWAPGYEGSAAVTARCGSDLGAVLKDKGHYLSPVTKNRRGEIGGRGTVVARLVARHEDRGNRRGAVVGAGGQQHRGDLFADRDAVLLRLSIRDHDELA